MAETNRALLLRFKDPGAVARSQGGSVASFANAIAPGTIEAEVYNRAVPEVVKSLQSKGIEAEVTVVEPRSFLAAGNSHIAADLGFAIGGAGVVGLLWFLFSSGSKRK